VRWTAPTVAEVLASHGVHDTVDDLTRALRHSNRTVRALAAQELARRAAPGARDALKAALESDASPDNQVAMGYALALLGDEDGRNTLRRVCKDRTATAALRVDAAGFLQALGDESGLDTLFQIAADRGLALAARLRAATTAARFERSIRESRNERSLVDALRALLHEATDLESKVAVITALGAVGSEGAARALDSAAKAEADPRIVQVLRLTLQGLDAKRRTHGEQP
jgi:hypothetical protein